MKTDKYTLDIESCAVDMRGIYFCVGNERLTVEQALVRLNELNAEILKQKQRRKALAKEVADLFEEGL